MSTLTARESDVREVVKFLTEKDDLMREGVQTQYIRRECQSRFYLPYMSYDSVDKALRSLVEKGILTKPKRGYYLPCS